MRVCTRHIHTHLICFLIKNVQFQVLIPGGVSGLRFDLGAYALILLPRNDAHLSVVHGRINNKFDAEMYNVLHA